MNQTRKEISSRTVVRSGSGVGDGVARQDPGISQVDINGRQDLVAADGIDLVDGEEHLVGRVACAIGSEVGQAVDDELESCLVDERRIGGEDGGVEVGDVAESGVNDALVVELVLL